jgi:hypothetical protein
MPVCSAKDKFKQALSSVIGFKICFQEKAGCFVLAMQPLARQAVEESGIGMIAKYI